MKHQSASQQQDYRQAPAEAISEEDEGRRSRLSLTEEQRRVLECLEKAGNGLTARQIESRTSCASTEVDCVLVALLEHRLIARLNTIIPSYTARITSPPLDDQ